MKLSSGISASAGIIFIPSWLTAADLSLYERYALH